MARFIAVTGPQGPDIEEALRLGSLVFDAPHPAQRHLIALNGGVCLAITRSPDGSDLSTRDRVVIVIDGHPHHDGQAISAETVLAHYRSGRLADLLEVMDGGFSVFLHDPDRNTTIVIRDALGIKSVYRARLEQGMVFASTSGAIMRSGLVPRLPDLGSVIRYAGSHYRVVYGPTRSFFKGVELIPPACCLTLCGDREQAIPYWELDPQAPDHRLDDAALGEAFIATITEATRNILSLHGTDGAALCLSGGIDSGALAGVLHHKMGRRLPCVSIRYAEATDFNETALAVRSIEANAADSTLFLLDHCHPQEDMGKLYSRFDTPIATVSIYAYDVLFRKAAALGYTTLLSGGSGDALQGGNYPAFLYHLADLARIDPAAFETELAAWIHHHSTPLYPKSRETVEKFLNTAIDLSRAGALRPHPMPLARDLINPDMEASLGPVLQEPVPPQSSYLRSFILQEYRYEVVPSGSLTEDISDWTHGTVFTSPYLSRKVVEFGWRLPARTRIHQGINKVLARQALRGMVPDPILNQISKTGFNAPFDLWLRGPLREMSMDIIHSGTFRGRGFYNLSRVDALVAEHMAGTHNHQMALWQILNSELWAQAWLDG